jgi:hypothetical protein
MEDERKCTLGGIKRIAIPERENGVATSIVVNASPMESDSSLSLSPALFPC